MQNRNPRRRITLGDIVSMPLPTEWAADVVPPIPNGRYLNIPPGATPGSIPNSDTGAGAGFQEWGMPGGFGPWSGYGAEGSGPGDGLGPQGGPDGSGGWNARGHHGGSNGNGNNAGGGMMSPDGLVVPFPATQQPGGNWTPQALLPDWVLPPALQRSNPLMRQMEYRRNQYDNKILRQAWVWDYIKMHGGIKTCCQVPELGAPVYDGPPFDVMPSQAQPFQEFYGVQTQNFPANGTDVVLGSFQVPIGYDGIINRVVFQFTGNGFADFSGDIVWRVKVALRYVRDLGNVTTTFGSFQNALLVPGNFNIRLVSGQTITLIANIPAGSPVNAGAVSAGAFGYFYPRR